MPIFRSNFASVTAELEPVCASGQLREVMHRLERARVSPTDLRRRSRRLVEVHIIALIAAGAAYIVLRFVESEAGQLVALYTMLGASLVFVLALLGWPFIFADAFLREYVAALEARCDAMEAVAEFVQIEKRVLALDPRANDLRRQVDALQGELREEKQEREQQLVSVA